MTRRWVVAGLVFGVLWVFVRGAELAVDAVVGQFLLGAVVGMPVAYLFRRLYEEGIDLAGVLTSVPYAVLYGLVFLREVVVANFDVAYRVLAPRAPIEPQVIFVPLRVETDLGITTIANSITITPGTITLDHDPEENALYVHVIDGRDIRSIVEPIRTWENYALVMFDEPLSPDDPAPEIAVHPEDRNPPRPADHRFDRDDEDEQVRDEQVQDDRTNPDDGTTRDDRMDRDSRVDHDDRANPKTETDRDDRTSPETETGRDDGGEDDGR